ncbi:MAG: hypothetical protein WC583_02730 [Candidatus Omnitrophota bacterium]|jgi:hypothetical protein|nr:hypothetical protein [Sphaerochaeta sp.]
MDLRDLRTWANEARRRVLLRREEMYAAALLPNQKKAMIERMFNSLRAQFYEIDHEEEIAGVEELAKRRLAEMRERRRAKTKKKKDKLK